MMAAADTVTSAVIVNAGVVGRMEPRQIGKQMTGEPGEGLRLTNEAHRCFQVMASPGPFQPAPRGGETLTERTRVLSLPHDFLPKRRQKRFKVPPLHHVAGTFGKISK